MARGILRIIQRGMFGGPADASLFAFRADKKEGALARSTFGQGPLATVCLLPDWVPGVEGLPSRVALRVGVGADQFATQVTEFFETAPSEVGDEKVQVSEST